MAKIVKLNEGEYSPLAKKMGAKFLPPKDYGIKKKRPRYVYEVYWYDTEDCKGDPIFKKFPSNKAREIWYEQHKNDPDKFGMYAYLDGYNVNESLEEPIDDWFVKNDIDCVFYNHKGDRIFETNQELNGRWVFVPHDKPSDRKVFKTLDDAMKYAYNEKNLKEARYNYETGELEPEWFYGVEGVEFVPHGQQSPEVVYNDKVYSYYDLEDYMYDIFKEKVESGEIVIDTNDYEDLPRGTKEQQAEEDAFEKFVKDNADKVYSALEDLTPLEEACNTKKKSKKQLKEQDEQEDDPNCVEYKGKKICFTDSGCKVGDMEFPTEKEAQEHINDLKEGYDRYTVGELRELLEVTLEKLNQMDDTEDLNVQPNTYRIGSPYISIASVGFIDLAALEDKSLTYYFIKVNGDFYDSYQTYEDALGEATDMLDNPEFNLDKIEIFKDINDGYSEEVLWRNGEEVDW